MLKLDQVHLREIWWTAAKDGSALAVQCLVLVTDPNVLAEPLCAVDLVITNANVVSWDPNHGPLGAESFMLEGSLHQLITLLRCEIFQFVVNTREESMTHVVSG